MKKILLTLALLLASLTASAQPATHTLPNTVFGLTLGKPLTLPVCEKTDVRDLLARSEHACYIFSKEVDPATAIVHIVLPPDQRPEYIDRNIVMAALVHNQLQSLSVFTPGHLPSQQAIIKQLTQQFGKPLLSTIVSARDHQNGDYLTAGIGSHLALWQAGNLQIFYNGTDAGAPEVFPMGFLLFTLKPAN